MSDPGDRLPRARLAEQARVDGAVLARLLDLGILAAGEDGAFSPSDVYRVRLVDACERAGLPAEAIARAMAEGHLSLSFTDQPQYRWLAVHPETYGELASRLGLPFEVMQECGAAMGWGRLAPEDPSKEGDEGIFRLLGMVLPLSDVAAVARMARIYSDSTRRITEAESSFYDTYILGSLLRQGISYGEAVDRAGDLGEQVAPLLDHMLVTTYRRQQEHAWKQGIVENIERVVMETGSVRSSERPTVFAFVDLAGYTHATDVRGDREAALLAREMSGLVDRRSAEHGGTPVKWLGDGVMVLFRDGGAAVRATLEIVDGAPAVGLPAHAGIAAGPVVMQDGDYFGRTVNLASRIAGGAVAGQTLVTDLVVDLAGGSGMSFAEVAPLELKGFMEPVRVFEAGA
ncbi:MAG TPA: adenylate/guanylate cyclase domain-containing protein [Actinomycetota bacterium]|nr:adenylate/guanylate cyclase domain-containing protein [Actinomycetota bacterium]